MLVGPQSPKYHYYTTKLLSLMNVTVESSRGYMTCDDVTALMAMTSFKYFSVFFFFFFFFFRPATAAYGNSPARRQIGAIGASLHYSHSDTGSELHL